VYDPPDHSRTNRRVVVVTLTLPLFAGFLGALWRVSFWGAVGGHSMHGVGYADPMFRTGFGVPLAGVLGWAFLLASGAALGDLLYRLVGTTGRERAGPGDTA
jgi:hypothetical protein